MQQEQKTGLVWFRNDLRIHDNLSLWKARSGHEQIIGVYCFDPRHFAPTTYGFKKTEKYRAKFLIEAVDDLQKSLEGLNIPLIVVHDRPEKAIPALLEEHEISAIYCQREWTEEESSVVEQLRKNLPPSISINESYDQFLYHPEDCPIAIEDIPRVFTSFRKSCEKKVQVRPLIPELKKQAPVKNIPGTRPMPTLGQLGLSDFDTDHRSAFPFKGGENQAQKRIQQYFFTTKKLGFYKKTRNGLVGTDYSSKLSPWLACGCISPRQIYWAVKDFEREFYKNQSTYWLIFELIWRDFFKYVSLKHQNRIFYLEGILDKSYAWSKSEKDFTSWTEGQTAEAFVNANMIELRETGWMSNRGRQNAASYLAKDLKIDWRMGAAWFESLLIDYDVHSNYGNWMYVAGVGNDPRDRKFNIRLQAERYDPQSKFRNLWLQKTLF
jgi:deoxyribodipyrimidine photo-lyase